MRSSGRVMMAVMAGMGAGSSLDDIARMFAPHLIAEFGWSRANFANSGLYLVIRGAANAGAASRFSLWQALRQLAKAKPNRGGQPH